MKTDVYKFERSVDDIDSVTEIAEKIGNYNGLDRNQKLRLSLLCEELVEMLPNLLIYGKGQFWIENKGPDYRIHALVEADDLLSSNDREEILAVSKSGRNAAAVGIMNKIKIAAESMLANYALSVGSAGDVESTMPEEFYEMGINTDPIGYSNQWSLASYKKKAKPDTPAWDELEKSVIANMADDVTVGIIGGKVEIVVIKRF
ncbi:MAG: hypothetical protein IK093_19355 [Ruminiclostridium sp.]|nr:hypothetical protein [Ruminiclostridium sp.]